MREKVASDARQLIRPFRGELKRLLQELVRTNTVAVPPGGNETPGQKVLQRFLQEHGVCSELYDTEFLATSGSPLVRKDRNYRGRMNLSAVVQGTGRGKSLLLNGHMDTVPPGRVDWTRSPWSGHFQTGRVHGLGSFDMKGGVVANAAVVCALSRAGIRPGGDVMFESVVDEEWGGGGGTIAARLRGSNADACVIPEGTQLEIYRATRGGLLVDLVVDAGDPAAYFSRAEVVGPAVPMGRLLGWIDRLAKQRGKIQSKGAYAGFPDPVPVQVLAAESNRLDPEVPLSVPSRATVRVYFQFLPEEDVDVIVRNIRELLGEFCSADPFFRKYPPRWEPFIEGPLLGHELSLDHPWTRCMVGSASAVLGRDPVVTAAPYPCDAGLIHRDFGIPTLLFGPRGAGPHNPNEYVEFDSVVLTAEVLLAAALLWTNAE